MPPVNLGRLDRIFGQHRSPHADPEAIWDVQRVLLALAIDVLGPRVEGHAVYRPVFKDEGGPNIVCCEGGHYAALSNNASKWLPTAVFELAYLTTYLLDPPVAGPAISDFEEGVALAFARHALEKVGLRWSDATQNSNTLHKLELARRMIPMGVLVAAREVRRVDGALCKARASTLRQLGVNEHVTTALVTRGARACCSP